MKFQLLKEKEVNKYCSFLKKEIKAFDYFTEEAKKGFIKDRTPTEVLAHLNFRVTILAKIDDEIIGVCEGEYQGGGVFWIDWILVNKNFRRQKVAQRLLDFTISKIPKSKNIHKIGCDTILGNDLSNSFFKDNNFRKVASFKNHWFKQDYDQWEKLIG